MRRSTFTECLKMEILQAVEGGPPDTEVLRTQELNRVTFSTWK